MVKNIDIVIKDYPELVSEMISHPNHMAYDIRINKVTKCATTPCKYCMFSNENNDGEYGVCNDRAEKWLNTEVTDVTDISDNTHNKDGEITW